MPGMNYLEGQTQGWNALGGLGSTFSDAVYRLRENSIRAAQWQQQMQMAQQRMQMGQQRMAQEAAFNQLAVQQNQQRFGFDRDKWTAEAPGREAEMQLRQAQAKQLASEVARAQGQQQLGGELGMLNKELYSTDPGRTPESYNLLRSMIAEKTAPLAAMSPANIVGQMNQLVAARDPRMQQMMATGTPMYQTLAPSTSLVNMMGSTPRIEMTAPDRPQTGMDEDLKRYQIIAQQVSDLNAAFAQNSPEYSGATNLLRQLTPRAFPGMAQGQQPVYASNPQTGERIMSLDGGKTWSPAPLQ